MGKEEIGMNGYLILSGAMIVCFADRELGSLTLASGIKISVKYPLFGAIMIVAGVFV